MSFSSNPYRWFTFFTTTDNNIVIECSDCGGESDPFPDDTRANAIVEYQRDHVLTRHGHSEADFAGWSQPNHRDANGLVQQARLTPAIELAAPAPEWVVTEWQYVRVGDHVRMGAQEANVTYANVQTFNAHEGDWVWSEREQRNVRPVTKWVHKECSFRVAHLGDELLPIPPGAPVEILMDRERQAIYLLQTQMNGTVIS